MENEVMLGIMGILFGGVYAIQIFIIKRLNFTCVNVAKLKTFAKLIHPEHAKSLD